MHKFSHCFNVTMQLQLPSHVVITVLLQLLSERIYQTIAFLTRSCAHDKKVRMIIDEANLIAVAMERLVGA